MTAHFHFHHHPSLTAACHTHQEKERSLVDAWFSTDRGAPNDWSPSSKILQSLAGLALKSRRGPVYGNVSRRQAHDVLYILSRRPP